MTSLIAFIFAFFATFLLVGLAIGVITLIAGYKLYEKAGVPGWKFLIPVYNYYVLTVEVAKLDVIWFVLTFLGFIPIVGWLISIVAAVNVTYSVARRFTSEQDLMIIATIFFPVFIFVFAFGNFKYDNGEYGRNGFFNDDTVENVKSSITGVTSNTSSSSTQSGKVNFCKNCGNKVKSGEKFCSNCGTKL
jgi:hypothetical protein